MIQILSWNIRAGGGSRVSAISKALISQGASIVALSEFRNNPTGKLLSQMMANAGWKYQLMTQAPPSENTVCLLSKLPFESSDLYEDIDPIYSQNIAAIHFEVFSVCAVYLPHKKKHVLFDTLNTLHQDGRSYVIAGDYNTGINYVDQKGNSFMYESDFKQMMNKGPYIDAFRHHNGDKSDYSWYSHQGNGFRYDHTLVNQVLIPISTSCDYIHEWRLSGLSDHSAMILDLG